MPDHPVVKFAGRRLLQGSFHAEVPMVRRLVADCPSCSSTDTKPLSYTPNRLPYSVYECRVCAHVWRVHQAAPPETSARSYLAALPFVTARREPLLSGWSLMSICPTCHSRSTEDLDIRPSILPDSLWRCRICYEIWRERRAIRPRLDPPHVIKADALRRRKRMTGRHRSCATEQPAPPRSIVFKRES
jgi:hypothetical protein